MATRKVTLSLDTSALALAEQAADRAGVSMSAWLSRAARREAVRAGYTPPAAADVAVQEQARADENEHQAAEEEMRAAG